MGCAAMTSERDAAVEEFLDAVREHLNGAVERHPKFKGVECLAAEFADVVKAVELDSGSEIRRQCVHLAVVALRQYLECRTKGETMKPVPT